MLNMARKKWSAKRINVNLSENEYEILAQYSLLTKRDMTDVIRELVRGLQKKLSILRASNPQDWPAFHEPVLEEFPSVGNWRPPPYSAALHWGWGIPGGKG